MAQRSAAARMSIAISSTGLNSPVESGGIWCQALTSAGGVRDATSYILREKMGPDIILSLAM